MKTTFNTQAARHLGVVSYDGSETPLGVNARGLAFEDANYALAALGGRVLQQWEECVIGSMLQGHTCGVFRGIAWRYDGAMSCHKCDEVNG